MGEVSVRISEVSTV